MTIPHSDIAVIGAGMAGIACARQLAGSGQHVVVFDKSKGMGGRMATRRGEGSSFDHGAPYFTTRDPQFAAEVAQWQAAGWCAPWQGRIVALSAAGEQATSEQTRHVGTPGMSALCRALAQGLTVHSQLRVQQLRRAGEHWQLDFDDGSSHRARRIVLAVPAPQAAALLGELPALQAVASAIDMLPCWSVLLQTEQPLPLAFDGAFISDSPLSWVVRNNSKPQRPAGECWVLHGSSSWSQQAVDLPAADVAQQLCAALAKRCGIDIRPQQLQAHRWLYAQAATPIDNGFLLQDGVGVAGDWCHGNRIEGAYLSGLRLAQAILG